MTKRRLAALLIAVSGLIIGAGDPGRALLTYEAGIDRAVSAGFHLLDANGQQADVDITAVASDAVRGVAAGSPSQITASEACITVARPGSEAPTQTFCGPANIEVSPTLDIATASGVIEGIRFSLQFMATDAPSPQVGLPTSTTSSSVGMSRGGTATASLIGGILGEAKQQGSSWYAEAEEKVKTSAGSQ